LTKDLKEILDAFTARLAKYNARLDQLAENNARLERCLNRHLDRLEANDARLEHCLDRHLDRLDACIHLSHNNDDEVEPPVNDDDEKPMDVDNDGHNNK